MNQMNNQPKPKSEPKTAGMPVRTNVQAGAIYMKVEGIKGR